MLFALLLLVADAAPALQAQPAPKPAATAPAKPSLFELVAQRMSPAGRPIFERYVAQTLNPRVKADSAAESAYLNAVRKLMAAPKLDLDAVTALIDRRKRNSADNATAIRASAFAMIKTLPPADRKLALTAIFADTRLPAAK